MIETANIIAIKNLQRRLPVKEALFGKPEDFVYAVISIDLEMPAGKTIGLVGESGCGNTTIGKLIAGLDAPTLAIFSTKVNR